MAHNASTYKKMPGRWLASFTRRTLWQGPDHLLWVEKTMMQEHYRRFYYKDIQAVIVRRNRRQHLWTFFWGALVLVTGSLALPAAETPDLPEFYGPAFFTLLWGVGLLANLFMGPFCEFYLQTAVQLERLTNMARQRNAFKTADRIKTLAENAQGRLQERPRVATEAAIARGRGFPAAVGHLAAETHEPFQPQLHGALFAAVLCQGVLGGLQWWLRQSWPVVLGWGALGATVVLVIVTLVRRRRLIEGSLLSTITWLTLVLAAAHCLYAYGLFIFASMRSPEFAYNYAALFRVFLGLHLEDQPVIVALAVGFAVGESALGLIGLAALALHGERRPGQGL